MAAARCYWLLSMRTPGRGLWDLARTSQFNAGARRWANREHRAKAHSLWGPHPGVSRYPFPSQSSTPKGWGFCHLCLFRGNCGLRCLPLHHRKRLQCEPGSRCSDIPHPFSVSDLPLQESFKMVVSSLPKAHEEQISPGTFWVSRTEFTRLQGCLSGFLGRL